MGIFTRLTDIVSANINAMIEKAEDPEKLIKLMIQEMEDTLVEIKASCAGAMAERKKVVRHLDVISGRVKDWENRAKIALEKGREDLAREALAEKHRYQDEADRLEQDAKQFVDLVDRYQADIRQLEEKLDGARNQHRVLVQRQIQAQKQKEARGKVRSATEFDAALRFEKYENRIERLEAESDLVNYGKKQTLEEEFEKLELDQKVEDELAALKKEVNKPARKAPANKKGNNE